MFKKGIVKVLQGFLFNKQGRSIETLADGLTEESKCGCGIDCCLGALVLKDISTGDATYVYVEGGVVKTTTDKSVISS